MISFYNVRCSSTRLSCPTFATMGTTPLTLLSVMFNNMRQYRINAQNVLTVNDALDQDGNITSQQLTVSYTTVTMHKTVKAYASL